MMTKASYRTHLKTYLRFCVYYSVTPVPISQVELLAYVAFVARSLKPTSINNYLNAIRIFQLEAGLENPLCDNFQLQNLKKGIARELGSPPNQMQPITVEILRDIRAQLSFLFQSDIAFWAACIVCFFGFLRQATLLPSKLCNPGTDCILRRDVYVSNPTLATITVRKTKTIQYGQRVLKIPFVASLSDPLCPVTAIRNQLMVSSKDKHLPFFSFKKKDKVVWWTHSTFVHKLRELLSRAGYDESKYSGHSFRRGGASLGFEIGLNLSQIKQRGDWASSAVDDYIFFTQRQIQAVAKDLIVGASKVL